MRVDCQFFLHSSNKDRLDIDFYPDFYIQKVFKRTGKLHEKCEKKTLFASARK